MLRVRDAQLHVFRRRRLEQLERQILERLLEERPLSIEGLATSEIRRRVRKGVAFAFHLGFEESEVLEAAVLLMFELHPGWALHPEVPPILDSRVGAREKMLAVLRWYERGSWADSMEQFGRGPWT